MRRINCLVLLLVVCYVGARSSPKNDTKDAYPMFWTWLDYQSGMNFDSICTIMNETGIDGVMLNVPIPDDYRAVIPIAQRHDVEVYAWLRTMNPEHDRDAILKEHPGWFSVNRNGQSLADTTIYVDYYKFMCPTLPEVRESIKKKIGAYCEVEGLSGIAIDYNRSVNVILPTTPWPKYGIAQDQEYPQRDFGYHSVMIERFKAVYGYNPKEQKDPPRDEKWLQFRCGQIAEVADMIADVVHSYDKKMTALLFPTPKMASKMARQDWGKWNLNTVFPMIYHNFCMEDTSSISNCTIEDVRNKNPKTTLYCGLMVADDIENIMDAVLSHGAEGIFIFTVSVLRVPEGRTMFRAYADSVHAVHAENNGVNSALSKSTKITNPLESMDILNRTNAKAKELANVPIPNIADYKLVDERGATKYYEAEELNTGKISCVDFHFCGGILPRWGAMVK